MTGLDSIFAQLADGSVYRLTDWLTYEHAIAGHTHIVQRFDPRFMRDGGPVTIYVDQVRGDVEVLDFVVRSQDDPRWNCAPRIPSGEVVLKRWSVRTYVSKEGAAKAWNRATGNRFVGRSGGWIYTADGSTPVCQGWASLLGARRVRHDASTKPGRYRYLAVRESVNFTRTALAEASK